MTDMMGSRGIVFRCKNYFKIHLFKKSDFGYCNEIRCQGFTEHPSIIGKIVSYLNIREIDSISEKEYFKEIANPLKDYSDEKAIQYGHLIWMKPDNFIKKEFIETILYLKKEEFRKLKPIISIFFSVKSVEFKVNFNVVGMKLGNEIDEDRIPKGNYLPIIGYSFEIGNDQDFDDPFK